MPRAGYGPGQAHLFRFRPAPVSGIPCRIRGLNSRMRCRSRRIRNLCGAATSELDGCEGVETGLWSADMPDKGCCREDRMATVTSAGRVSGAGEGILDREHTIAKAGFNRWLVPPAALCIHLCIGMAYGFSVFWLPLVARDRADGAQGLPGHVAVAGTVHHHLRLEGREPGLDVHAVLRVSRCLRRDLGRLAGARRSAQGWRSSPRCAGAADFFSVRSAFITHQLWIMWLGSGVIGGVGLGLGYISPVSTLVKWFPDRRGMATGMAIMGFGGGAMIGAPLGESADELFQDTDLGRRLGDLRRDGRDLLRVHDDRRVPLIVCPPAGWRPRAGPRPSKPMR